MRTKVWLMLLSGWVIGAACGRDGSGEGGSAAVPPNAPSALPSGGRTSGTPTDNEGGANTGLYVTNDGAITRSNR